MQMPDYNVERRESLKRHGVNIKECDRNSRFQETINHFHISTQKYYKTRSAAHYTRLLLVPAGGTPASRAGGLRPP